MTVKCAGYSGNDGGWFLPFLRASAEFLSGILPPILFPRYESCLVSRDVCCWGRHISHGLPVASISIYCLIHYPSGFLYICSLVILFPLLPPSVPSTGHLRDTKSDGIGEIGEIGEKGIYKDVCLPPPTLGAWVRSWWQNSWPSPILH